MLLPVICPTSGFSKLIEAINSLSQTSNLQVCVDARDGLSYTSGQTLSDVSGNGQNFVLGASASSGSDDPTFNGTAGDKGAYFSLDGGDYFTYNTTNPTWVQTMHQNNATWTLCMWFYPISAAGAIFGDMGSTAGGTGVRVGISPGNIIQLFVYNAGTAALSMASSASLTLNKWNFLAISINEATGSNGLIFQLNSSQETHTSTYSSPSTGNASYTFQLMAGGNNLIPSANTSRFACAAIWTRALSASDLTELYDKTKSSFGV